MIDRLNLVLFGPPGAGKSTQAALLTQSNHLRSISTGQKLRETVASGSALGREVEPILKLGQLIDDTLMMRLLDTWIDAIPASFGLLLDGFPRTVAQAEALEALLGRHQRTLDRVVALVLSDEAAVHRLSGRRICHIPGQPEQIVHIDDQAAIDACVAAGGTLAERADDAPEAILHRLSEYNVKTEPLLRWYADRDLLEMVDADGTPAEVNASVLRLLDTARL